MDVKREDQWIPGPLKPEGSPEPRRKVNLPQEGLAAGAVLVILWYLATRTTLIVAYGAGSMSQAQSLCGSGIGYLARGISRKADLACSRIASDMNWWNLAGFAGLLLLVSCAGWLMWRTQQDRRG